MVTTTANRANKNTVSKSVVIPQTICEALDQQGIYEVDEQSNVRSYNDAIKDIEDSNLRTEVFNQIFELQGTRYKVDSEGCLQPIKEESN